MSLIKSDFDEIEIWNSSYALYVIGIFAFIVGILVLEFPLLSNLLTAILSSLIGVFVAVFFINYLTSKNKQNFRKRYLIKVAPILKRNLTLLYIDLGKLVNIKGKTCTYFGRKKENYKSFLENTENFTLNEEKLEWYYAKLNYEWLFDTYRDRLFRFVSINSHFLPPNLVLNISEIIERLDSLVLQMKLKNSDLVLKNTKAIFGHFNIIDENNLKLCLDD